MVITKKQIDLYRMRGKCEDGFTTWGNISMELGRESVNVMVNSDFGHYAYNWTHAGLVAALLVKYYGNDQHGQGIKEPLHTIPTKDRYGLATVNIDGEPYTITDIGMRMLQPRELFRCQGFPDDWVIDRGIDEDGNVIIMTKTDQVHMCGNSVCPTMAKVLVEANATHPVTPYREGVRDE
ncbi:MAG: DNA cytosine methyltransferase [Phycisphaeraceae bacterium]|nr:DNA cytosine methyltransferase [Phycisphaeraceae bacterium]